MQIDTWLKESIHTLNQAQIETARLDCLVLLSDEIGKDKSWVLAHPEYELQIEHLNFLSTKITQRAQHTPLAYIRGKSEFYGRDYVVNTDVLVPRPESEDMIDILRQIADYQQPPTIYDIGTGSGALASTAKLELPKSTVFATDIDPACLRVAKNNAERLEAHVTFLQGDLLEPVRKLKVTSLSLIILANLPYVPTNYPVNHAATQEPKHALYSGTDGLDHYRSLFTGLKGLPTPPEYLITESLLDQHEALAKIAKKHSYTPTMSSGLVQLFCRSL